MSDDPFVTEDGAARVLFGAAVLSGSLEMAELAGRVGFDTVWIDIEHGAASFADVERLCMAVEAGGAIPTVRLSNHGREHILRALEVGARIVVVPMVNDAETAREIVRHGKFPPLGERGFNTRSRGVGYGLESPLPAFERANRRTHLIAQIETKEAADNLDALCAVEGLAGILVGPGDLSVSLGKTGQFTDPELIALVADCLRRARAHGKHAGILVAPGAMLDAALAAGCDFAYIAGDINNLAQAWRSLLAPRRPA